VVQYYDYALQAPVYGNPDLEMTVIENADLRLEHYMPNGDNVALSGFYKYFTNHIELLQTAAGGFTWRNADRSEVLGAELEGRFGIVRGLEWRGNVTVMESRSFLYTVLDGQRVDYTTPMYGQAPYIVNSTLSYTLDSLKLTLSGSYNVQGAKLAVTNAELDPDGIRAFELPRHLIDLTLNKRFGEHWTVNFRVRDLLNSPTRRAYKFASGYDLDFDSYQYGTEYILTLGYSIR
jgi:outer membrane receptor protein involved in Fe transport